MGKITINELHKSLYNHAQAVSDESLMTESKTIVNAINEIYGKQLIANAIGEPLNDTDTFTKMSNDINELLSTFKTNMMNSGVTVESGDKFKALIDKIKGLTEDEGNKGVQYVEGTIESAESSTYVFTTVNGNTKSQNYAIIPNLPFEPIILILDVYDNISGRTWISILSYDSSLSMNTVKVGSFSENPETASSYHFKADDAILTNNYIRMPIWGNKDELTFKYCAIGVGEKEEEDTTLSGGLNIISATTLPATGKENQICVITSNPTDNYVVTNDYDYSDTTNIILYNGSKNSAPLINIVSGSVTQQYYITKIIQNDKYKLLESYYWSNNQWNSLTKSYVIIVQDGEVQNTNIIGGIKSQPYVMIYDNMSGTLIVEYDTSNSTKYVGVTTTKKIDFGKYTTVTITAKVNRGDRYIYVGQSPDSTTMTGESDVYIDNFFTKRISKKLTSTSYVDLTFDISGYTGEYYLGFGFSKASTGSGSSVYIKDIKLS